MKRTILIFIGIIALFHPISATLSAKEMMDGHLLERVTFNQEGKRPTLLLQGIFSQVLITHIQIIGNKDPSSLTINIPGGFVNNLILPKNTTFNEKDPINYVQIDELVQADKQGRISNQLNILVKFRKPTLMALEPALSNANQLAFILITKMDKVYKPEPIGRTIAQETEVELKHGMDVEGSDARMPDPALLHPVMAMMVFQKPPLLQISILNASSKVDSAQQLAIYLDRQMRGELERQLNMSLAINNISSTLSKKVLERTKIYFAPNYLPMALTVAAMIPGDQAVEMMPPDRRGRLGVNLEIFVGENFE